MAKKQQSKTAVKEEPGFFTNLWYNIVGHPEEWKIKEEKRSDIKAKKKVLAEIRETEAYKRAKKERDKKEKEKADEANKVLQRSGAGNRTIEGGVPFPYRWETMNISQRKSYLISKGIDPETGQPLSPKGPLSPEEGRRERSRRAFSFDLNDIIEAGLPKGRVLTPEVTTIKDKYGKEHKIEKHVAPGYQAHRSLSYIPAYMNTTDPTSITTTYRFGGPAQGKAYVTRNPQGGHSIVTQEIGKDGKIIQKEIELGYDTNNRRYKIDLDREQDVSKATIKGVKELTDITDTPTLDDKQLHALNTRSSLPLITDTDTDSHNNNILGKTLKDTIAFIAEGAFTAADGVVNNRLHWLKRGVDAVVGLSEEEKKKKKAFGGQKDAYYRATDWRIPILGQLSGIHNYLYGGDRLDLNIDKYNTINPTKYTRKPSEYEEAMHELSDREDAHRFAGGTIPQDFAARQMTAGDMYNYGVLNSRDQKRLAENGAPYRAWYDVADKMLTTPSSISGQYRSIQRELANNLELYQAAATPQQKALFDFYTPMQDHFGNGRNDQLRTRLNVEALSSGMPQPYPGIGQLTLEPESVFEGPAGTARSRGLAQFMFADPTRRSAIHNAAVDYINQYGHYNDKGELVADLAALPRNSKLTDPASIMNNFTVAALKDGKVVATDLNDYIGTDIPHNGGLGFFGSHANGHGTYPVAIRTTGDRKLSVPTQISEEQVRQIEKITGKSFEELKRKAGLDSDTQNGELRGIYADLKEALDARQVGKIVKAKRAERPRGKSKK